jgi:penicillin-insensitive murein endopeptidase
MKYPAAAALAAWLLLAAAGTPAAALHNPWATVPGPAPGPARVIGGYTAGCIQGAESLLPDQGPFELMRTSRERYYAHPALRALIGRMAAEVRDRGWGKLLVGDLSQPRGGPTTTGHASHQAGLDADIWFWLDSPARQRPLTAREKDQLSARSMLNAAQTAVDPDRFGDAQVQLLRYVATQPEVQRILLHPAIKQALCERTREAPWLNKVRPWWGHHYHFHLRLACPPGQTACEPQTPPPAGPECGASLAWWFSAEAMEKARQNAAAVAGSDPAAALARKLARVPGACAPLLEPALGAR